MRGKKGGDNMKTGRKPKKITRRQALGTMAKVGGAAVAGLAVGGSATRTVTAASTEA